LVHGFFGDVEERSKTHEDRDRVGPDFRAHNNVGNGIDGH